MVKMDDIAALADSVQRGVKELADENFALRGEVAELKEMVSVRAADASNLLVENARLQATLSRYREAVEWILDRHDSGVMHREHDMNELRRRAGEGE